MRSTVAGSAAMARAAATRHASAASPSNATVTKRKTGGSRAPTPKKARDRLGQHKAEHADADTAEHDRHASAQDEPQHRAWRSPSTRRMLMSRAWCST